MDGASNVNVNSIISKYVLVIRELLSLMLDYFASMDFLHPVYLLLHYMFSEEGSAMRGYFSQFELARVRLTESGSLELEKTEQQILLIGGLVLVRVVLLEVVFKFYKQQSAQGNSAPAKWGSAGRG